MSLEGAVDGSARVVAEVEAIKRVYSATATGDSQDLGPKVKPIPKDISDTPVAIVRHERFTLGATGTPDVLKHYVTVEIWVNAADPGTAEKIILPLVSAVLAAFKLKVALFGNAFRAKTTEGGPPIDAVANRKTFIVYPITIEVTELNPAGYQLGPSS